MPTRPGSGSTPEEPHAGEERFSASERAPVHEQQLKRGYAVDKKKMDEISKRGFIRSWARANGSDQPPSNILESRWALLLFFNICRAILLTLVYPTGPFIFSKTHRCESFAVCTQAEREEARFVRLYAVEILNRNKHAAARTRCTSTAEEHFFYVSFRGCVSPKRLRSVAREMGSDRMLPYFPNKVIVRALSSRVSLAAAVLIGLAAFETI